MPLNAASYLGEHGWQGKGVPLDGKEGRGLRKPLALPMKRNLKGLGKDRDRATEWWDCLFEASAKSINIQVGGGKHLSEKSASDIAQEAASALEQAEGKIASSKVALTSGKVSLVSQAKREYARKMLMSGFVRGREIRDAAEEELEEAIQEQEKKRTSRIQSADESTPEVASGPELTKEERVKFKEEKRKRREARRLKKEAKQLKRQDKELRRKKYDQGAKKKHDQGAKRSRK